MQRYLAMLIVSTAFLIQSTSAQKNRVKIKFGDIKAAEFTPTVYSVDSSANAVYLFSGGNSSYVGNNRGNFSVIYTRHTRIRLLNKNSFELATVEIPLYVTSTFEQRIEKLEASTYNIENGQVVVTKLDKASLFKEKSGNVVTNKFTFPNIKEGSIIEYKYTINSPSYYYVTPWAFQDTKYPRLWSEYEVSIPAFYDFVVLKKGYLRYTIDTAMVSHDNYTILDEGSSPSAPSQVYSFGSNTVNSVWAMKDVPVLKKEEFITTLADYVSKISFQLSAIRYPDRPVKFVMRNWIEEAADLMKDEDFGIDLKNRNGWMEDDLKRVTAGAADDLEKAKKIYEYVRDSYTCTDFEAKYLSQPLKKTFQTKKGNVADINLLLTAMYINRGYEAEPVMLSTRENGIASEVFPDMEKLNYVINRVNIKDHYYLLDAANDRLGFGRLSDDCYNGSGRIIAELPALVNLSTDSLKENKLTSVFIINGDKGMEGTFSTNLGYFESLDVREKLKKTKEEDFFKAIKKEYSFDVDMTNTAIDSLKLLENPISIKYDMKFNVDEDMVYFTPLMTEAQRSNPFSSAERFYPVDRPYCTDETYVLNMDIPKGYVVDELPKSARVKLNEDQGTFEYIIAKSADRIQLRCRTQIKKASFEADDYQTLRDFFAFVVKKEAEQIVFKKAN